MDSVALKIAEILLDTKAVKLSPDEPFTWSSGWKSPIYCDNRITLSFPDERKFITNALANRIKQDFPDVQCIAGVATAGIAQGALVANLLELPFIYVRPKPKAHGMKNCVEGRMEQGQKIILVEDLISTGGSSLEAARRINEEGGESIGIVAAFTYEFAIAEENSEKYDVPVSTLSNYSTLIDLALQRGLINQDQLDRLSAWREAPESWS